MRLVIKIDERSLRECLIDDEVSVEDIMSWAEESNEWGCFDILNMELSDGVIKLNEGFDIGWAMDQVSEYEDYIENEIGTPPVYYTELMNRNDYMGDDAAFDYCGSYMSTILGIIAYMMEVGSYDEEN